MAAAGLAAACTTAPIVEPARLLPGDELADRVCARFGRAHEPHLVTPEKAS